MIGVLSDAHGNHEIFQRTVDALSRLGAEHFIFLGDAVGYIPSAEVVSNLMKMGDQVRCVLGNHEQMLLTGLYPDRLDQIYRMREIRGLLKPEHFKFVSGWPTHLEYNFSCGRSLFVHGSPADYQNGYLYPDSDLSGLSQNYDFIFMGHTHRPFIRQHETCTFVNVGSCGLPRDDGRYASAVLFDPSNGRVRLIRIELSFFDADTFFAGKDVHQSVADLFKRRQADISGEFIESK